MSNEMSERNNFYEEDEPIEKILAGWEAGEKGLTAPPADEPGTSGDWTMKFDPLGDDEGFRVIHRREPATAA